jgi:aspartate/methionine/tyrosine aminotransferase
VPFRPELAGIPESPLVGIATEAEQTPGAIKLCYGESDMPTPEFICRAAYDASLAGHTFYTHTAGCPELREAIAAKILALHDVSYLPSEIMATVGGSMAIYVAIRAVVGAGDNVVIVSPAYAIYANAVAMSGGEPRFAPLTPDGDRYRLDLDRVRESIDSRTRLLIVNSPSNPTGWMISIDEQRGLAELAERYDLRILADEVYERLVFDHTIASSMARVVENRDRLIVINSFSKTYSMTGWRLGWAQGSEATIRMMYSAAEFMTSNPTSIAQQAGIVALRDGEAYVQEMRDHLAERRAQVRSALVDLPGLSFTEADGAFYAFPRVGRVQSSLLAVSILREAGVALAPGSAFGPGGEGHVRLCFAASQPTITTALARLREFFEARFEYGDSSRPPRNAEST